jgi:hypothetical protein
MTKLAKQLLLFHLQQSHRPGPGSYQWALQLLERCSCGSAGRRQPACLAAAAAAKRFWPVGLQPLQVLRQLCRHAN